MIHMIWATLNGLKDMDHLNYMGMASLGHIILGHNLNHIERTISYGPYDMKPISYIIVKDWFHLCTLDGVILLEYPYLDGIFVE